MGAQTLEQMIQAFMKSVAGIPDPGDAGAIKNNKTGIVRLVTAGASETRTLAAPTGEGHVLMLIHDTDGGDATLTVTGNYTDAGGSTIKFTDAGEWCALLSILHGTTYCWRMLRNDGCTLA